MSIQIPQNMTEVEVQLLDRQKAGEQVTKEEIIRNAVKDTLQALMDEALEGHYDDVKWDDQGQNLLVFDIMGKQVGKAHPQAANFVADFTASPDNLMDYFTKVVTKIVGGRWLEGAVSTLLRLYRFYYALHGWNINSSVLTFVLIDGNILFSV